MNESLLAIKKSVLFTGVSTEELRGMLECLNAYEKSYKSGEYIYRVNDNIKEVGFVSSGKLLATKEDFWGNDSILSYISQNQIFGESFVCMQKPITINIMASEDSKIIFLSIDKILTPCEKACDRHRKLIYNFAMLLASKNLLLTQKINYLSQRTTREKLMCYLSEYSKYANSPIFEIPLNRQQLADYLSVDRSAMSNELSKMQRKKS